MHALRFWKQELKRQKPSFFKTNARYLAKYLILIVLLNIVREAIFCTLLPFFLARLIKHFSVTSQVIGWNVFMDSFALIVCSIFHMLLQHPHSYLSMLLTVKTKVSWVTLIYRKVGNFTFVQLLCSNLHKGTSSEQQINGGHNNWSDHQHDD